MVVRPKVPDRVNLVDSKIERLKNLKPEKLRIKPGFEMVIVIGKGLPERKAIFACIGFICVVEIQQIFKYWYEVARPLSSDLKGGRHINCPYGCVGRGRVRVVTHGPNLPRQGPEKARKECGSYLARGASQSRRP